MAVDLIEANNPIGIRPGLPEWEGECTDEWNADTASFKKPAWAYRAGAAWLIWRADAPGANTLAGIFAVWDSVRCKANRSDYIAQLSSITGWALDQIIKPKSYLDCFRILRALTIIENTTLPPFKDWQIIEGMRRAGIADMPPTPWHKRYATIGGGIAALSSAAPGVINLISPYEQKIHEINSQWVTIGFYVVAFGAGLLALWGGIIRNLREK